MTTTVLAGTSAAVVVVVPFGVVAAAGVCSLSDSIDAVADPQLEHRNHFRRVPQAYAGETVVEGSHYQLSRTPSDVLWGGPPIGEHTFEILSSMLGYDGDKIADLAAIEALY